MPATDFQRIAAFRASFARRQAATVTEVPGGFAVLDPEFAASHEHNQLVIDRSPDPGGLPALADALLGELPHRRVTVLDDAAGAACAPVLTAAGYTHEPELVMAFSPTAPVPEPDPDLTARPVTIADLRPALARQLRVWMPEADDAVIRQLVDRRRARLRGADAVRFLAVRDQDGAIGSWADIYLESGPGIAQVEDLVTADTHTRRGYADALLATALRQLPDHPLFFLVADAGDWPRTWYARRGFRAIARSHVFTRTRTAH